MPLEKTTVFVVDDDDAVRDSLKLLLESHGMQVEAYASTEAFAQGYRPHGLECLILDQNLQSGKTGIDFLASGVPAGLGLPVILVTGRGGNGLGAQALRAGAASYLEKPLDDQRLLAAITAAVAAPR